MADKQPLGDRLKGILSVYGPVAIWVYLGIFAVVLAGFAVAIASGVQPDGAAQNAGVLAGAWVATKLTQPLRIAATLVLTPVVERVLRRVRNRPLPEQQR